MIEKSKLDPLGKVLINQFSSQEASLFLLTGAVNLLLQQACMSGLTNRDELTSQLQSMCDDLLSLESLKELPEAKLGLELTRRMLTDNLPSPGEDA